MNRQLEGLVHLTAALLHPGLEHEFHPTDESDPSELRTSSYVIYVDLPQDSENMLLVHGYTGVHLRVSRQVATFLRARETRRPPRPLYGDWIPETSDHGQLESPSDATIAQLARRGLLVSMSPEREEAWFAHVAQRAHAKALLARPSFTILLTYACNLRCVYCFQQDVRNDHAGPLLEQSMSIETIDRLVSGIHAIEAVHGVQPGEGPPRKLRFFGGEPLLARNRPALRHWLERLAGSGTIIAATTNGTELHHVEDLLGPDGITHLDVTLDGPPDVHDRRRLRIDGQGSFGSVADNITIALERGTEVQIRVNVDRNNAGSLARLLDVIETRGWAASPGFLPVQLCAVHASTPGVDRRTVYDGWQLRGVAQALEQRGSSVPIKTQDTDTRARIRQIFERQAKPSSIMSPSFCVAHTTEYLLDSAANIFVCAERTCDSSLRVGHVTSEGEVLVDPVSLHKWRGRTVASNSVCRRCRYAFFCGGGCAAQAEVHRGDIYNGYCDGFDRRFRAMVAETYLDFIHQRDTGS